MMPLSVYLKLFHTLLKMLVPYCLPMQLGAMLLLYVYCRVYDIGIDVRFGQGRYRDTRIVTLATRYQLENRTQHTLAFSQRHFVREQVCTCKISSKDTVTGIFMFWGERCAEIPIKCLLRHNTPRTLRERNQMIFLKEEQTTASFFP